MIFGHGDDTYRYGDQVKINFSSNIYQKADLSELEAYLSQHLDAIRHYPAPIAQELEEMIAAKLEIPANMVMVTSGANEAIYLIAQLYRGWSSVIPQPTYHEYLPQDRIYWLCNPDNPTGNVIIKPLIMRIIKQHPRFLYVLDQSYADYTIQPVVKPKEVMDCYNVMLLRSFSKKYCIPGLRLGYLTASPIIIDRLRNLRQPWTVNTLAIEAGKFLVEHDPKVLPDIRTYLIEAQRLKSELEKIDGLMIMDTFTHYMLVNVEWTTSLELKNWLMANRGILIRDASNFHGLDIHCFRVAAQTPEENDALIAAIKEFKSTR